MGSLIEDYEVIVCGLTGRLTDEHPIWEQFQKVGQRAALVVNMCVYNWRMAAELGDGETVSLDSMYSILEAISGYPEVCGEFELIRCIDRNMSMEGIVNGLTLHNRRPAMLREAVHVVLTAIHDNCWDEVWPKRFLMQSCFKSLVDTGKKSFVHEYPEFSLETEGQQWRLGSTRIKVGEAVGDRFVLTTRLDSSNG